jgi:hypothetical protein
MVLMAFSFSILSAAIVSANENRNLSPEKLSNIENKCDSLKQSLKRIQNSDRNTRVSIGRSFQTITNNFVTPLNVRLVKNNRSNSELTDIQSELANARDNFNRKYIEYSQGLEDLIAFDCKNNPEGFYRQLEKTRAKRGEVASASKAVTAVIEKHVSTVKKIRDNQGAE